MAWRYYRTDPIMAAPDGHIIRAAGDRFERLDDRKGLWDAQSTLAATVDDADWERSHRITAAVADRLIGDIQRAIGPERPIPHPQPAEPGLPTRTHQSQPDQESTSRSKRGHASEVVSVEPREK